MQNLDIRDIDFDRKRITLTGKGDKTRVVPIISDEFSSYLKYLESEIKLVTHLSLIIHYFSMLRKSKMSNLFNLTPLIGPEKQGFVFCYNEGEQLSLMAINKIVAKAGKRVGISNPNP
ncbi:MAG: tyrosine-type recombinase/integrase [Candidatus Hodarchaeota archaeon]